jgi:hypothetical protein
MILIFHYFSLFITSLHASKARCLVSVFFLIILLLFDINTINYPRIITNNEDKYLPIIFNLMFAYNTNSQGKFSKKSIPGERMGTLCNCCHCLSLSGECDMGSCLRLCSNSPGGPTWTSCWQRIPVRGGPVDRLAREVDDSDLMLLQGSAHCVPTKVA